MMKIGKILILGFGSVGQGLLPLLFREFPYLKPSDIQILTADDRGAAIASEYGVKRHVEAVTPENYIKFLKIYLEIPGVGDDNLVEYVKEAQGNEVTTLSYVREELVEGSVDTTPHIMNLLINVSVNVSSIALMEWCKDNSTLYCDTCVEPWQGGYESQDVLSTTNFYLREQALALREEGAPTALIANGANPGLVTAILKEGLLKLANRRGIDVFGKSWSEISREIGVQIIQIAEKDTQMVDFKKVPFDETKFYNTWSCDGFISELNQRAEVAWGSHEKTIPTGAIVQTVRGLTSLVLSTKSIDTGVKSYSTHGGDHLAGIVTHHETLSIAEMLSGDFEGTRYQPTVYYAYVPCRYAVESINRMRAGQTYRDDDKVLLTDELIHGSDNLTLLLIMEDGSKFMVGNNLFVEEARNSVPHNSATTLQVTSTIVAGIHWMLDNPHKSVVEPEQIDHRRILGVTKRYIGATIGYDIGMFLESPENQFADFAYTKNPIRRRK
jgi:homospermidine synthase